MNYLLTIFLCLASVVDMHAQTVSFFAQGIHQHDASEEVVIGLGRLRATTDETFQMRYPKPLLPPITLPIHELYTFELYSQSAGLLPYTIRPTLFNYGFGKFRLLTQQSVPAPYQHTNARFRAAHAEEYPANAQHQRSIQLIDKIATYTAHRRTARGVAFSPDGTTFLTSGFDSLAVIRDAATGSIRRILKGHKHHVYGVAFSPDGRTIATVSSDTTARIWSAATGELLQTLRHHTNKVIAVAFSSDGSKIVTGSADTTAVVSDVFTGTQLLVLKGHRKEVWGVAFSPDGSTIATVSQDCTLRLWNSANGICLDTLQAHERGAWGVAFSPDGKTIATSGYDNTAKIWDAAERTLLRTLSGHTDFLFGVAFSPDGGRIVTGSLDRTARLWNVRTGEVMGIAIGHTERVFGVAFSSDGCKFATASDDHTVSLWASDPVQHIADTSVRSGVIDSALHPSASLLSNTQYPSHDTVSPYFINSYDTLSTTELSSIHFDNPICLTPDDTEVHSSTSGEISPLTDRAYHDSRISEFMPAVFSLRLSTRPNPAQEKLEIHYGLREPLTVTLELLTMTGQVAQTILTNQAQVAGQYTLTTDLSLLGNGVYLLRMRTNKEMLTTRVDVVK